MRCIGAFLRYLPEVFFLIVLYVYSQLPLRDFDIWFHIKSGELFVREGRVVFADYFSHAANGRYWFPFEWLFQIIVFLLSTIHIQIIPLFIAVFTVILFGSFLYLLRRMDVPLVIRLLIAISLYGATTEFFTARPHVLAYSFIALTILLIFLRVQNRSRLLFLLPFLTIFWTHIHSTAFLSWGLIVSFLASIVVEKIFTRKHIEKKVIRDFLVTAFLCFFATLTPPEWGGDYKLLWTFFHELETLSKFVAEWGDPNLNNPFGFRIYVMSFVVSFIVLICGAIARKEIVRRFHLVPFFVLALMGFTASRNVALGFIGIATLFAVGIRDLFFIVRLPTLRYGIIGIIGFVSIVSAYWSYQKHEIINGEEMMYPVQAAEFAKRYLKGNMFNDYSYGGYLVYAVYPKLQVFIDGRTEVYLCCEVREYMELALRKHEPDDVYGRFIFDFFKSHDVAFAILPTTKHSVLRRIAAILSRHPDWALVFWDDASQVFVRRESGNDWIIGELEAKAATPFLRLPFLKESMDQAEHEYRRMDGIAKSARTSNALGYIALLKGDVKEARKRFEEAIDINPFFESPYMNLGELAAKDGDLDAAIQWYTRALQRTKDRGMIYIRLGDFLLQKDSANTAVVRKIWERGARHTIDDDAREELKKRLEKL